MELERERTTGESEAEFVPGRFKLAPRTEVILRARRSGHWKGCRDCRHALESNVVVRGDRKDDGRPYGTPVSRSCVGYRVDVQATSPRASRIGHVRAQLDASERERLRRIIDAAKRSRLPGAHDKHFGLCAECGCLWDEKTLGCPTCTRRHRHRRVDGKNGLVAIVPRCAGCGRSWYDGRTTPGCRDCYLRRLRRDGPRYERRCRECGVRWSDPPTPHCDLCARRETYRTGVPRLHPFCGACGISWQEETKGCEACYRRALRRRKRWATETVASSARVREAHRRRNGSARRPSSARVAGAAQLSAVPASPADLPDAPPEDVLAADDAFARAAL
jgi:hypothetical protein